MFSRMSLKWQIALSVLLICAFLVSIIGGIFLYNLYTKSWELLSDEARLLVKQASYLIATLPPKEALEQILLHAKTPEIEDISLYTLFEPVDEEGVALAKSFKSLGASVVQQGDKIWVILDKDEGFPVPLTGSIDAAARGTRYFITQTYREDKVGRIIDVAYPIRKGDKVIGVLRGGFCAGKLGATLQKMAAVVLASFVFSLAIGWKAVRYTMENLVHPVREIMTAIDKASAGELDYRIPVEREDELGKLMSAFNNMMEHMQEYKKHLEKYNIELEELVKERTRELREKNRALQNAKTFLDNLFFSIGDMLVVLDTNGIIKEVNDAVSEILEYSKEELVGQPGYKLCGDDTSDFYTYMAKVMEQGRVYISDINFLTKSGDELPVHISLSRVDDDKGNPRAIVVLAKDIRDITRLIKELEISRDELRARNEELQRINMELEQAHREIVHLARLARDTQSFDIRFENPYLVKCWELKECGRVDCPAYNNEDLRCWLIAGASCERGENCRGCDDCMVYKAACPTPLAEIGEAFNSMMAMLQKKHEELVKANERLREADRLKSQFLANMSHELRTPLNAIIGFSEILLDGLAGELTPQQWEFANNIHSSGKHLLELINDLLDLSKIEAGKMQLEYSRFSIRTIIDEVRSTIAPIIAEKEQEFSVEIEDDLPELYADKFRIKQVLLNLLSNATKFTDKGGKIGIKAYKESENFVTVAVWDTGCGIPEDQREAIFDEFRQVDGSTSREHEGTGLGLAISKRIVELHGGRIWVESKVGEGSTFYFTIPTVSALVRTTAPRRTVLVVEDDTSTCELITIYLNQEGYNVVQAHTGEDALRKAHRIKPDLITLDILLPDIDGWEVLHQLKEDEETKDIPVVIVSIVDNKGLGLSLGADAYLVKPINREDLVHILEKLGLKTTPDKNGITALIVDDDPACVQLMSSMLESEGYAVLRAYGGEEALEILKKERPDFILLDLLMPDVTGLDVISHLQEDPDLRKIPIIVVTAKALSASEKQFLKGKIKSLMHKGGFTKDMLLAQIKKIESRIPGGVKEDEESTVNR